MDIDSFIEMIRTGDECCLLKDGSPDIYPSVYIDGKVQKAHRLAYSLIKGAIPEGVMVCHHCDTPGCFNPDHLFLGSQISNQLDSISKGRRKNVRNKLSPIYLSGELKLKNAVG